MLMVASLLVITEIGSETTSLQTLVDKVTSAGHDIERIISRMENQDIQITPKTLAELADNYRATTGLLVEIVLSDENLISISIEDPGGVARYSSVMRIGGE